MIKLTFS